MLLLIDGYNLLHSGRFLTGPSSIELQRERDRLVDRLSAYRRVKSCRVTAVFDGWQGGWPTEKRERQKGIELIFSRIGEKADEVIKRLIKEKGSGAVVVTSDREIANHAEKFSAPVIPSERFLEKLESAAFRNMKEEGMETEEDEERDPRKKGPSRRPSKKEKRLRSALRKL